MTKGELFKNAIKVSNKKKASIAKDILDYEKLLVSISAAAEQGKTFFIVRPPNNIRINESDYAKKVCKKLLKEGFGAEWRDVLVVEINEEDKTKIEVAAKELVISWGVVDALKIHIVG